MDKAIYIERLADATCLLYECVGDFCVTTTATTSFCSVVVAFVNGGVNLAAVDLDTKWTDDDDDDDVSEGERKVLQ